MQRPIPPKPSPWELIITDPADHQTLNPAATIAVQGTITGPGDSSGGQVVVSAVSVVLDHATPQALSFSLTGPSKYNFSGSVGPILLGQHTITVSAKLSNRTYVEDTVLVGVGSVFCQPDVVWQNWAGAAGVATGSVTPALTCTPHSLADLIQIVRDAEAAHLHVHPYCTGWSFSDAAITSDSMVDMRQLNRPIQKVQRALSSAAPDPTHLYHVEAGITIRDLYTKLNDFYPAFGTSSGNSRFIRQVDCSGRQWPRR